MPDHAYLLLRAAAVAVGAAVGQGDAGQDEVEQSQWATAAAADTTSPHMLPASCVCTLGERPTGQDQGRKAQPLAISKSDLQARSSHIAGWIRPTGLEFNTLGVKHHRN